MCAWDYLRAPQREEERERERERVCVSKGTNEIERECDSRDKSVRERISPGAI